MANSSSEDETDTLPERPTRIQPYQFEPARQDFGLNKNYSRQNNDTKNRYLLINKL